MPKVIYTDRYNCWCCINSCLINSVQVGFLALKALVLAEAYISHKKVLPENVICAILDAFEKTVESKNVLYSACLDLFDFARKVSFAISVAIYLLIFA